MPCNDSRTVRDLPPSVLANFWRHVYVGHPNECWEWFGQLNESGYGRLHEKHTGNWMAHRVAYYIGRGDFARGLCVCHHCDNRKCVNWHHLFKGTIADNNHDRSLKGRSSHKSPPNRVRGEASGRAKITARDVRRIRKEYASNLIGTGAPSLAKRYGLGVTTIYAIIKRINWRHIR